MNNIIDKILKSKIRLSFVTAQEAGVFIGSSLEQKKPDLQDTEISSGQTASLISDALGIMGGQIVE